MKAMTQTDRPFPFSHLFFSLILFLAVSPIIQTTHGQDGTLLTSPTARPVHQFGYAVALSGDYALVGANNDYSFGQIAAGAAYVFKRQGHTWQLSASIIHDDINLADVFGTAVDMAGDYALISSPGKRIASDTYGAAYLFKRSGESWDQQTKFVASDVSGRTHFGSAVALGTNLVFIGATDGTNAGVVYVFTRSGNTWTESAILKSSNTSNADRFGNSIALAYPYVIIGAPGDDSRSLDQGAAYVFRHTNTGWVEEAILHPSNRGSGQEFGYAVAIHNTDVLIGARSDNTTALEAGSVYFFKRAGSTWSEDAYIPSPNNQASANFGASVALYRNQAIVGAPGGNTSITATGASYVYERVNGSWSSASALVSSKPGSSYKYGAAVAIGADYAIVGEPESTSQTGAAHIYRISEETAFSLEGTVRRNTGQPLADAYVFVRKENSTSLSESILSSEDGTYSLYDVPRATYQVSISAKGYSCLPVTHVVSLTVHTENIDFTCTLLQNPSGVDSQLLAQVSFSNDSDAYGKAVAIHENYAIVGVPDGDEQAQDAGSALIYIRESNGTWRQQAKLLASDGGYNDQFGRSVALWGDYALVGAPERDSDYGGAYLFRRDGTSWHEIAVLAPSTRSLFDYFGESVALWGDYALVGSLSFLDVPKIYVYRNTGEAWIEEAIIPLADMESNSFFLDLWGDQVLIGAPAEGDNGTAYIYTRTDTTWTREATLNASSNQDQIVFGRAVSLRHNRAVIGAPAHSQHGSHAGTAYIFERIDSTWTQIAELLPSHERPKSRFGFSVAMGTDHAIVGAPGGDFFEQFGGSAYVYRRRSNGWHEEMHLTAPTTAFTNSVYGSQLGYDVALWHDTALLGAPQAEIRGNREGGGLVFDLNLDSPAETASLGGTIVNAQGMGVSGATLHLTGVITDSTTTSPTGAFTFEHKPFGNYTLSVAASQFLCEPERQNIVLSQSIPNLDIACWAIPPANWTTLTNIGSHATLSLSPTTVFELNGWTFEEGDAIGAFFTNEGVLQGAGYGFQRQGQDVTFKLWGDNAQTTVKEGFAANEPIQLKLWDSSASRVVDVTATETDLIFAPSAHYTVSALTSKVTQELPLTPDWNLISSFVVPDTTALAVMFARLDTTLRLIKDQDGQVYWPTFDINTLGQWNPTAGYQIYMNEPDTLHLRGFVQDPTTPIALREGWNTIAYLHTYEMSGEEAFAQLTENLIVAKDNRGQVYWPNQGINTLMLYPGQGYKVYLRTAVDFQYPAERASSKHFAPFSRQPTRYFSSIQAKEENGIVAIRGNFLSDEDEVSLWTQNDLLVGSSVVKNGKALVIIRGDNPLTDYQEGAQTGDVLETRYWSHATKAEHTLHFTQVRDALHDRVHKGPLTYLENGLWESEVALPKLDHFALTPNYPNPFSDKTTIGFTLPHRSAIRVEVFNTLGRLVAVLVDEEKSAGYHSIHFDGKMLSSGTYFYRLQAGTHIAFSAMQIVR